MTDPTPAPERPVAPPSTVGDAAWLATSRRIHIVAVGGSGMSAIARILAAMGHEVSGSDRADTPVLARLRDLGVDARAGHDGAAISPAIEVVARSTAIGDDNEEVVAARAAGIPVWSRAEILAAIAATRRTVAVAGTHGKTSTSSMLAVVLREAGLDPSFVIGADVTQLGTGAEWGSGDLFVVEADESDGTFVALPRQAAVVTNVEPDHLEHWGGFAALEASFVEFLRGTDGPRVVCLDDEGARSLLAASDPTTAVVTYGTDPDADLRIEDLVPTRGGVRFALVDRTGDGPVSLGTFDLPVPGEHNARNAAAAVAMGRLLGAGVDDARAALAAFGGVARRFQVRGERDGITFVDDYAHLRTEVRAALAAARGGEWRRVVCVFQPHRYSRTESLWPTFADAFDDADLLVVTGIYPSGEAPRPGVTSKLVVDAVLDRAPRKRLAHLPTLDDVVAFLARELRPGDLCLTLGAGDLTTVPDRVLDLLADRSPAQPAGAPAP